MFEADTPYMHLPLATENKKNAVELIRNYFHHPLNGLNADISEANQMHRQYQRRTVREGSYVRYRDQPRTNGARSCKKPVECNQRYINRSEKNEQRRTELKPVSACLCALSAESRPLVHRY